MALYSLKKISNEASSRRTYLRGVECYNAGKVHAVHRESGEYYPEYLTAEVENDGRDGEYHVEIGFDAQGEADYYECGCPDSRETEGACKHVVALMVHKYYTDMVAGMTTAGKLLEESRLAAARTDEAARRMIDRYVSREAVQMVAATTGAEEKVSLTPILQWGYRQAELTFTLGGGRSYVLKDIAKFCADMKNNETVEYGKQLRFLHHPDCFDETSRPLLSFLLGRYEEILAGRGSAYPAVPPRVGRELPLSPSALDRFFALYAGREVAFRDGQKTGALRLAEGNPPLTAEIGRSTVKQGFTVRCDAHSACRGPGGCTCTAGIPSTAATGNAPTLCGNFWPRSRRGAAASSSRTRTWPNSAPASCPPSAPMWSWGRGPDSWRPSCPSIWRWNATSTRRKTG